MEPSGFSLTAQKWARSSEADIDAKWKLSPGNHFVGKWLRRKNKRNGTGGRQMQKMAQWCLDSIRRRWCPKHWPKKTIERDGEHKAADPEVDDLLSAQNWAIISIAVLRGKTRYMRMLVYSSLSLWPPNEGYVKSRDRKFEESPAQGEFSPRESTSILICCFGRHYNNLQQGLSNEQQDYWGWWDIANARKWCHCVLIKWLDLRGRNDDGCLEQLSGKQDGTALGKECGKTESVLIVNWSSLTTSDHLLWRLNSVSVRHKLVGHPGERISPMRGAWLKGARDRTKEEWRHRILCPEEILRSMSLFKRFSPYNCSMMFVTVILKIQQMEKMEIITYRKIPQRKSYSANSGRNINWKLRTVGDNDLITFVSQGNTWDTYTCMCETWKSNMA